MQRALLQELDSEPDSYWNQSNFSSFTFDDETSGSTKAALEELGKSINFSTQPLSSNTFSPTNDCGFSNDLVETVDWSGTPVDKKSTNDRRANFSLGDSAGGSAVKFNVSSNSFLISGGSSPVIGGKTGATSGSTFPATSRIGASLSPEPIRAKKPPESTTSSIGGSPASSTSGDHEVPRLKREHTPVDISRLEAEHKNLRRKFEQLRRDRYKPPDIKESIRRIMRGDTAILELYTDKRDKISLLDAAIDSGDGNVITKVVLYLKHSLSYALFQQQIMRKPDAASHYLVYLRDHYKFEQLTNALMSLGRKEEAGMVEFRQASGQPGPSQKVSALKRLLQSGLASDPSLKQDMDHATEYYSLLERQQPIDHSDDNESRVGKNQKFKVYPKKASLVDQPVLTTLYYCCLYHYELPENSYASPLSVKKNHNLTEKEFCWVGVKALARQKRWGDIQNLLTSKAFYGLGGAKIKSPIPYPKLLDTLEKHGASLEILSLYLKSINDSNERLSLAKKFKCHNVVVDCLVGAKDRLSLMDYSSKLTPHTKEAYYAQAALQNSTYRWKN